MAVNSVQATSKGWMPGATKVAVPASNFSVGNFGRKAAVIHIGEGSASAILGEFTPEGKEKSAHFVVSNAGNIWQCVSVLDTAYANGLSWNAAQKCWVDPEKNLLRARPPVWPGLSPPTNPNRQTISIEREGYYRDVPSEAENAAVVHILQYVHEVFPTFIPAWSFMQTLIGHCHISPVARANCPGPHVDYAGLAAAANGKPLPPLTKRYRVKHRYVTQRKEDNGPPLVRELQAGEEVMVDKWYTNGRGHLASGEGFCDLADLEAI